MDRLIEMVDSLTPYEVSLGNTKVHEPVAVQTKCNTEVLLEGLFAPGAYGKRTFSYNRVNLAHVGVRSVYWQGEQDFFELLPKINLSPIFVYTLSSGNSVFSRQGFLKSSDIVNEPITMTAGSVKDVKLKANALSYLYIGELSLRLHG